MTRARAWLAGLLLLLLAACGGDGIDCDVRVIARVPMAVRERLLVVPVGIDGKWITLLVDTGAERTAISEQAANRLGLKRDTKGPPTRSVGLGGAVVSRDALVPGLVLGGVRFPVERVAVGKFQLGSEVAADGLLGSDVLLAYDLDIDIPAGQLTIYHPRKCPDVRPPWSEPAEQIAGVRGQRDRLLVPFDLDGVQGMGILDTGAQQTTIGSSMAARLGLTAQAMANDPIVTHQGAGPGTQEGRFHQFRALTIGRTVRNRPRLSVLPVDAVLGDGLVGQEFIDGRRLWVSFPSRTVFIAPAPTGQAR